MSGRERAKRGLRGLGGWGQIAMGHRGGIMGRGQINRFLPFRLERSKQKEISSRRKRENRQS